MEFIFFWVMVPAVSALVGYLIGGSKGNGLAGLLLGLFLGPLGWLIAAVLSGHRQKPSASAPGSFYKEDPVEAWDMKERAKTILEVPLHLRGKKIEDET